MIFHFNMIAFGDDKRQILNFEELLESFSNVVDALKYINYY